MQTFFISLQENEWFRNHAVTLNESLNHKAEVREIIKIELDHSKVERRNVVRIHSILESRHSTNYFAQNLPLKIEWKVIYCLGNGRN